MKKILFNIIMCASCASLIAAIFFYGFPAIHPASSVEAACHTPTAPPATAPTLLSAVPSDSQIALAWAPAQDPVTYYLLEYGTSQNSMVYGNPYIGDQTATSYTVTGLTNGTRYYFRVRAGNGCRPGKFSHTMSAIPGTAKATSLLKNVIHGKKAVLGASTSIKKPVKLTPLTNSKPATCSSCFALPLLLGEAIGLVIFFSVIHINKSFFKKAAISVFIPFLTALSYLSLQHTCSSSSFFCHYFLLVDAVIFILITVLHKQLFISRREHTYKPSVA